MDRKFFLLLVLILIFILVSKERNISNVRINMEHSFDQVPLQLAIFLKSI